MCVCSSYTHFNNKNEHPTNLFYLLIYKNSAPQAGKSLDPSEGSTIKATPLLFLLLLLFCTHKTEWPPIWYNTTTLLEQVVEVVVVVVGRGEGGAY
jgi:hypothetical protein